MGQVLPFGIELCAYGRPLPHEHDSRGLICLIKETVLSVVVRPQWKGTVLCADWTCTCGTFNHVDDITFGVVTCGLCGSQFRLETDVLASPVASPG